MQSIPSLPLFSDPLCPGVITPDRVLYRSKIELFDTETVHVRSSELLEEEEVLHLTLSEQMTDV